MALHGEIKVNGAVIYLWSAVRTKGSTDPDSINTYRCSIAASDRIWGQPGFVYHRYGDGAVVLAAKVLAEYTR